MRKISLYSFIYIPSTDILIDSQHITSRVLNDVEHTKYKNKKMKISALSAFYGMRKAKRQILL
jgi:hypothetical protein